MHLLENEALHIAGTYIFVCENVVIRKAGLTSEMLRNFHSQSRMQSMSKIR